MIGEGDLARHRPIRARHLPLVPLVLIVGWVVALAIAVDRTSYDIWGGFWVAGALAALTVPIARLYSSRSGDNRLAQVVLLAFGAKVIVGTVLRYATIYTFYDGSGDATKYDEAGKLLAPLIRHGTYPDFGPLSGTRFTEVLTGHVYAVIGPTRLGGFLVFSWLAFLGLLLLVRAFEIAVPDGDHRRYRYLVLFFPTLLFWPSSIGKDAWMLLCIGAAAYGLARLVAHSELRGVVPAALGIWGAAVVRPHIALLLAIGGSAAALVRVAAVGATSGSGALARARTVVIAVLVVVGVGFAAAQTQALFDIDDLNPESAETVLTEVTERTSQGTSQFDAPNPDNPIGFLAAVGTALFRPLPIEANNALTVVSSLEGLFLLGVIATSLGRLARLPYLAPRRPYVLFALAYSLAFAYAFSAIDNFGILARQRAQMLPLFFVLLALPARAKPPGWHPTDTPRDPASLATRTAS